MYTAVSRFHNDLYCVITAREISNFPRYLENTEKIRKIHTFDLSLLEYDLLINIMIALGNMRNIRKQARMSAFSNDISSPSSSYKQRPVSVASTFCIVGCEFRNTFCYIFATRRYNI